MNYCKLNLMIAICAVSMSAMTASAQSAKIEEAFIAISQIPGFETFNREQIMEDLDWDEDEPALSKEWGEVWATAYGNADPREQFLAILDNIPANLLYKEERDELDKITRWYIETDADGVGYFMYIFVGWGGNDTFAMFYKGADAATYERLSSIKGIIY